MALKFNKYIKYQLFYINAYLNNNNNYYSHIICKVKLYKIIISFLYKCLIYIHKSENKYSDIFSYCN